MNKAMETICNYLATDVDNAGSDAKQFTENVTQPLLRIRERGFFRQRDIDEARRNVQRAQEFAGTLASRLRDLASELDAAEPIPCSHPANMRQAEWCIRCEEQVTA